MSLDPRDLYRCEPVWLVANSVSNNCVAKLCRVQPTIQQRTARPVLTLCQKLTAWIDKTVAEPTRIGLQLLINGVIIGSEEESPSWKGRTEST